MPAEDSAARAWVPDLGWEASRAEVEEDFVAPENSVGWRSMAMSRSSVNRSAGQEPPSAAWMKRPAVLSQTERAEQRAVSRDDEPFAAELETDAKIPRSTPPPTRGSEQDTPSASQQNSKMMLFRFTEQATSGISDRLCCRKL